MQILCIDTDLLYGWKGLETLTKIVYGDELQSLNLCWDFPCELYVIQNLPP